MIRGVADVHDPRGRKKTSVREISGSVSVPYFRPDLDPKSTQTQF